MIVEGHEDLGAVVHLMMHHVRWEDPKYKYPVEIKIGNSVSEILDKAFLSTTFKQSGLNTLAILVDADEDVASRWTSIKNIVSSDFEALPDELPKEGLIALSKRGLRFGVWIMPDNVSPGMLETFLQYLLPDPEHVLWQYAKESAASAKGKGADFRVAHTPKAEIHTWLAWRDPPGERFGIALTKRVLDPYAARAENFVKWFRELFQLEPIDRPQPTA